MAVNIWKSYVSTAVEETNLESILAVMNTTELVLEIRPEKIQVSTGFEPITFAIPVQSSTNWANKPLRYRLLFWGCKSYIYQKYGMNTAK